MAADVSTLPVKGNGAMAVIPSEDSTTALDVARMLLEAGADPNIRLKRRPPYRDVPQDRGGDAILMQGATALLRIARRRRTVRRAAAQAQGARRSAQQGRRTPLMAAAGVEFGDRVTRGRNRTTDGVLATMKLLVDAGADINARMVTERRAACTGRSVGGRGIRHQLAGVPARCRVPTPCRIRPRCTARRTARLHAVREVPRRARRRSAGEGRQRSHAARSGERNRRAWCPAGCRRSASRNSQADRVADRCQGHAPNDSILTVLAIGLIFVGLPILILVFRDRAGAARGVVRTPPSSSHTISVFSIPTGRESNSTCSGPCRRRCVSSMRIAPWITRRDSRWSDEQMISAFEPSRRRSWTRGATSDSRWFRLPQPTSATWSTCVPALLRATRYVTYHDGGDTEILADSVEAMAAALRGRRGPRYRAAVPRPSR